MAKVTGRGLMKSYGAVPVIRGVDPDIEDGEFAVLVGPSGCGKSTLLRLLAGLEGITGGPIRIGGRGHRPAAGRARHRDGVPEIRALSPHDGAGEHGLRAAAAAHRQAEVAARVERSAANLELGPPRSLPAAAIRRPAAARGDGAGDRARPAGVPVRRAAVEPRRRAPRADAREIAQLHQRLRTTTVYVTHDQIEAMTLADKSW